jgi:hypothetical protein
MEKQKKPIYKNKWVILVLALVLIAVGINILRNSNDTLSKPKVINHKIYFEEVLYSKDRSLATSVLSSHVRLDHPITEEEVKEIANDLRKTRTQYGELFIEFYIKGADPAEKGWAIASFSPDLEVKILGNLLEKDNKAIENGKKYQGDIIGKWLFKSNGLFKHDAAAYIIERKNDKYFLTEISENNTIKSTPIRIDNTILSFHAYTYRYIDKQRTTYIQIYTPDNTMSIITNSGEHLFKLFPIS